MKKIITAILVLLLAQTAYAGTYMFREKASKINRWLEAKGESGSTYDMLNSNFSGYSTLAAGTLRDHVGNVMGQHGYTGTVEDQLAGFFTTTTSTIGWGDAERAFWVNDTYTFDPSGGGGPSGDAFLLELADYILLETGDYLLLE